MEYILVTTQDMASLQSPLPDNTLVVAFKIVNFGPNTLTEVGRSGIKICEITDQQPGFFIISESSEGLRQGMHDLVDRFCNARESKQNESANQ